MTALYEVSGMTDLAPSNVEASQDQAQEQVQELEDTFAMDPLAFKDGGLTVKQAVHFYNLPAKAIKERIRRGEIPAVGMPGRKGWKWRIYPDGVPEECAVVSPGASSSHVVGATAFAPEIDFFPYPSADTSEHISCSHVSNTQTSQELLKALKDMQARLEAAAYRNGYLEAQLASMQERCALLSDSQHVCRPPANTPVAPPPPKPWRHWFGELFAWNNKR
jgi:hypothetical protein